MGEALIVRRGERFDPIGVAGNLEWESTTDKTVDGYSKGKSYMIAAASYPSIDGSGNVTDDTISLWICVKGVISCVGGCYMKYVGSNTVSQQVVFGSNSSLGTLTVTDSGKFTYTATGTYIGTTSLFIAEL